ncbi:hypothetical protein [Streptomyces sp. NBC_00343]|uniref:hypothetical protein n=1 Tax=Streptomyces sp. NBC_00343 TaxID=2975719 RepID=UPI002E298954|nr:hypothetical protein [Streptomyces sp. NBC_00343]
MTVLVSVWGAASGVGKSTLCAGLSRAVAGAGLRVDHFREEEILSRPQFTAVAGEFGATGAVGLERLVAATGRFVASVLADGDDMVIADALMPFVPTVLAMGHGEEAIDAFMADLTRVLAPVRTVVVFLDGDAGAALFRAAEREEPGRLGWYVGKLAAFEVSPPVSDLASAVAYLRRERAVTLGAVRRQRWGLLVVGRADGLTPGEVLGAVGQGIRPWLHRLPCPRGRLTCGDAPAARARGGPRRAWRGGTGEWADAGRGAGGGEAGLKPWLPRLTSPRGRRRVNGDATAVRAGDPREARHGGRSR